MNCTRAFYKELFIVSLEKLPDIQHEIWMFKKYTKTHLAWVTELVRVELRGGRIEQQKSNIGHDGFIDSVYDTEGNMIGLHSLQ